MIRAFVFYLLLSLKNRVLSRWRRLRQPKYLISALAGVGYLVLVFHRQILYPSRPAGPVLLTAELMPVVESSLSFLLLLIVLFPWVWPGRGSGIYFTEAEIQFLFVAPVTRQSLLRFRMVKGQLGILFGVLISVLMFGRGRFFQRPLFLVIALWIIYSFLALYRMGVTLVKTSLAEHGAIGLRRQLWGFGVVVAMSISLLVWLKWFLPAPPREEAGSLTNVLDWLVRISQAGPAFYFLLPFRWLVRPAFAADWAVFIRDLVPALGLLFLAYLWVIRSDAGFEEAALARARQVAARLEARRGVEPGAARGRQARGRRALFYLRPYGPAHTGIFWKNLISAGRFSTRRLLIVLVSVMVGVALAGRRDAREVLPAMLGTMAAGLTFFLALMGPVMVRDDLRVDLLNVDLLKSYPVPGWSIVLGEILAPVALLTAMEWALLAITVLLLPGVGEHSLELGRRVIYGLALAIVLPFVTAMGVLVQNAAVILMPGWVQLGKHHARGVEAMGQRLITMAGTLIILVVAALPAGVLFFAAFFTGYWLIGPGVVPLAALVAALSLLLEAACAIVYLGRVFDRFDASLELDHF
jgi:hypothetical protein